MTNYTGDVVAMAQRQDYNPWNLPDSFTLYNYAPDDIKSFLHPHWHTMKALHPMWYYVIGLVYLVIGKFNFHYQLILNVKINATFCGISF